MSFRALTLMLVLGLHSSASAAVGLFHLCKGEALLAVTCCCQEVGGEQTAGLQAAPGACCDTPEVRHAPSPAATADADKRWDVTPLLAVPEARACAAQPLLDTFAVKWVRARGVTQATAPPLYVQYCSYLI